MATAWAEALAAYDRATAITNAIDSDKHEEVLRSKPRPRRARRSWHC